MLMAAAEQAATLAASSTTMRRRPSKREKSATPPAGGALALVLMISSRCARATLQFTDIGTYRGWAYGNASSSSEVKAIASEVQCCTLCSVSPSCTGVNYFASSKMCEFVEAGVLGWTSSSESRFFLKADQAPEVLPTDFKRVRGALVWPSQRDGCQGDEACRSYNVSRATTATHCWSLCQTLTGGCRMFSYHIATLECLVSNADFYDTWTASSEDDPLWHSYYKSRADGWKLIYKISKGIGVCAADALLLSPSNVSVSVSETAKDANCNCFLTNDIASKWSQYGVQQVSVALATAGSTVKYVNFSAISETVTTFFKRSNIFASSWTDLTPLARIDIMQMSTTQPPNCGRFLQLFAFYNGCGGDRGWLSVHGWTEGACGYDVTPVPSFAYYPGPTTGLMCQASFADALLMYVKFV